MKAEEVAKHIYQIIIDANTLNDMGDTYIPEEEIANYLKENVRFFSIFLIDRSN